MAFLKFLGNILILCFERRFSKKNSVIRLKSNILTPSDFSSTPNFWAGYATDCIYSGVEVSLVNNNVSSYLTIFTSRCWI